MLYVIRHGQTDYNRQMRFQGRMDIPLNDHGKGQARGNGWMLKKLLGDAADQYHFVSSPLGRARQTMELIRVECGLSASDYHLDGQLTEISFGDWEGYSVKELQQKFPELFRQRELDKWNFTPPGKQAENYATLAIRVDNFLKSIDRPTVCVCHGGVIRAMFYLMGHRDLSNAATVPTPQDRILKIENNDIFWL